MIIPTTDKELNDFCNTYLKPYITYNELGSDESRLMLDYLNKHETDVMRAYTGWYPNYPEWIDTDDEDWREVKRRVKTFLVSGFSPDDASRDADTLPPNWVASADEELTSRFLIGPYSLGADASNTVETISILEDYAISGLSAIRSTSDPVIRGNKKRIVIEVSAIFLRNAGIELLRNILAFTRATPLVPLSGIELGSSFIKHKVTGAFRQALREGKLEDNESIKSILEEWGLDEKIIGLDSFKEALRNNEVELLIKNSKNDQLELSRYHFTESRLVIPSMLKSMIVSTVPEAIDAIRVNFTFIPIADTTFTEYGLAFLDAKGKPTNDIRECAWLKRYIDLLYLENPTSPAYISKDVTLDDRGLNNVLEMRFETDPNITVDNEKTIKIGDKSDSAIKSIQISLQNKIGLMSIIGASLPMAHFMGRNNAMIGLTLDLNDDKVRELAEMNATLLNSLTSDMKSERKEVIKLKHGLINMLCGERFVPASVVVAPSEESIDSKLVTLQLVESAIKAEDSEAIFRISVEKGSRKELRDNFNLLWARAISYIEKFREREATTNDELMAYNWMFGNKKSIANGSVVWATVINWPEFLLDIIKTAKKVNNPYVLRKRTEAVRDELNQSRHLGIWPLGSLMIVAAAANDQAEAWTEYRGSLLQGNYVNSAPGSVLIDDSTKDSTRLTALRDRIFDTVYKELEVKTFFTSEISDSETFRRGMEGYGDVDYALNNQSDGFYDIEAFSEGEVKAAKLSLTMLTKMPERLGFNGASTSSQAKKNLRTTTNLDLPREEPGDLYKFSSFPDLFLPSYREVFTYGGQLNNVWEKFAPRYPGINGETVLPSVDAVISPAIFFTKSDIFDRMRQVREATIEERIMRTLIGDPIRIDWNSKVIPSVNSVKSLEDILVSKLRDEEDAGKEGTRKVLDQLIDKSRGYIPVMASDRNVVIAYVQEDDNKRGWKIVPNVAGNGNIVYSNNGDVVSNRDDPDEASDIVASSLDRVANDKYTASRLFPTVRLRFIDVDAGLLSDDVYEYSAIVSLTIHKDKSGASFCEIELANTTGNLDVDSFLSNKEVYELGVPDDEPEDINDLRKGRSFRSMKLKEGTSIQVLLGYDPDPDRLSIEFTGKIVELLPGDVFKIAAQGYEIDLLNEISFSMEKTNYNAIVRKVFNQLDKIAGGKNASPNLGFTRKHLTEEEEEVLVDILSQLFGAALGKNPSKDRIRSAYGDFRTFSELISNKMSRFANCKFSGVRKGGEQTGVRSWVAPYQPALDTLMEIARFIPGWICTVVPVDHAATLYFGPKDGLYKYTTRKSDEVIKWILDSRKNVSNNYSEIVIPSDEEELSGSWHTYARRFFYETADDLDEDISIINSSIKSSHPNFYRFAVGAMFALDLRLLGSLPADLEDALYDIFNIASMGEMRTGIYVEDAVAKQLEQYSVLDSDIKHLGRLDQIPTEERTKVISFFSFILDETGTFEYQYNEDNDIDDYGPVNRPLKEILGAWSFKSNISFQSPQNFMAKKIRTYIRLMQDYIRVHQTDAEKVESSFHSVSNTKIAPDEKPIVDYHFVTSDHDIIENSIVASLKQMANCVLVRYPTNSKPQLDESDITLPDGNESKVYRWDDGDISWGDFGGPTGLSFHKDLSLEEKKLNVAIEYNCHGGEKNESYAAVAAMSRMAESLQPMYRGQLVIAGRAVKPWDVVVIFDTYNEIRGPIEVERVIHHISPTTGWTTTIHPHLLVSVNNAVGIFAETIVAKKWAMFMGIIDVVSAALILIPTGVALGAGLKAATAAIKKAGFAVLSKKGISVLAKRGIPEFIKATGSTLVGSAGKGTGPNFMGKAMLLGTMTDFLSMGTGILQGVISQSDIEGMNGLITISPLVYQGRPLVAGLSSDDRIYRTLIGHTYYNLKEMTEKFFSTYDKEVLDTPTPYTIEDKNRTIVPPEIPSDE